ncbi:MAG: tetratricopeptide repeat protein [Proteobacteria bacterium]|nr:tetratricopeptide repeat protein [Pseudomonadota bacterium]
MQIGFVIAVFVMLASAAAIVLPPLWRGSRGTAVAVALLLPLACLPLYGMLGNRSALDPAQLVSQPDPEQQIDALATYLHAHPDQLDGWVLLARARKDQRRFGEADAAYAQALRLAPKEPGLLVERAETLASADPQHRIGDAAVKLLQTAQSIDPRNQRALWFLGIAAYQRGDYAGAATTWQPLLQLAPADTRASLLQQIDGARAKAGLPPLPAEAAPSPAPTLLTLRVDISPALRAKLAPDDVLFVFARAPSGPPMPLAVKRIPAKDFPLTVALSDDDGPMPTLRLSQQATVNVVARVSHGGQALPQSGDFESTPLSASVGGKQVIAIAIDRVHP